MQKRHYPIDGRKFPTSSLLSIIFIINGADFAEKAREEGPLSKVPVLLAYDGREAKVVEDIIEHEVGDVLLSPYASAQNLKKIQDRFPLPPKVVDCVRLWWMTAPQSVRSSQACSKN